MLTISIYVMPKTTVSMIFDKGVEILSHTLLIHLLHHSHFVRQDLDRPTVNGGEEGHESHLYCLWLQQAEIKTLFFRWAPYLRVEASATTMTMAEGGQKDMPWKGFFSVTQQTTPITTFRETPRVSYRSLPGWNHCPLRQHYRALMCHSANTLL